MCSRIEKVTSVRATSCCLFWFAHGGDALICSFSRSLFLSFVRSFIRTTRERERWQEESCSSVELSDRHVDYIVLCKEKKTVDKDLFFVFISIGWLECRMRVCVVEEGQGDILCFRSSRWSSRRRRLFLDMTWPWTDCPKIVQKSSIWSTSGIPLVWICSKSVNPMK